MTPESTYKRSWDLVSTAKGTLTEVICTDKYSYLCNNPNCKKSHDPLSRQPPQTLNPKNPEVRMFSSPKPDPKHRVRHDTTLLQGGGVVELVVEAISHLWVHWASFGWARIHSYL